MFFSLLIEKYVLFSVAKDLSEKTRDINYFYFF